MSEREIHGAIDGFLEIAEFLDIGLQAAGQVQRPGAGAGDGAAQAAAEAAHALIEQQHQALRWTYLGSGLRPQAVPRDAGRLCPAELERIDALAPTYC